MSDRWRWLWLGFAACTPGEEPVLGGRPVFPEPPLLVDEDPDPHRVEGEITAAPATLSITGDPVRFLAFNGSIPGPSLRVSQGDEVLIHFRNELPPDEDWPGGVHWHGIEGFNAADGTPVSQASVMPGGAYDYRFVATRPGVYWYHPHARGAQALFSGLYGPLIVEDPDERALVERGVLPADDRVLVLSDTWTAQGIVTSAEVDNAMEIMNGTEGRELLVNGQLAPVLEVVAGSAVRLRMINASITRFWRLTVPGRVLYRVGGEGGLLDEVRVEGGSLTGQTLDPVTGEITGTAEVPTGLARGELLLAPGERADVVLVTDGEVGEEWPLRWEDTARGRHAMWVEDGEMRMGDAEDDGRREGKEVALFRLVAGDADGFEIAEGAPLLAAVGRSVAVAPPATVEWSDAAGTTLDERMDHFQDDQGEWQMTTWFGMNGVAWHPDHMAGPSQPAAPSAKQARLGDVVRWEVRNNSMMAHPYHLHGFSYQPEVMIRWPDPEHAGAEAPVRVDWTHAEWEDTTLLPPFSSLFFRVVLTDPAGDGSAVGRWPQHCHILQHGENGMMSELIVQ